MEQEGEVEEEMKERGGGKGEKDDVESWCGGGHPRGADQTGGGRRGKEKVRQWGDEEEDGWRGRWRRG